MIIQIGFETMVNMKAIDDVPKTKQKNSIPNTLIRIQKPIKEEWKTHKERIKNIQTKTNAHKEGQEHVKDLKHTKRNQMLTKKKPKIHTQGVDNT